jgi:DNA-binding NarL/FixJ family response regulator
MGKIRLAIAEDNENYRNGIASILKKQDDIEITSVARIAVELLQDLREREADVVVMDLEMPMISGIEATKIISKEFPKTRVIGLTVHTTDDYIFEMQGAGAVAYLDKTTSLDHIIFVIRNSSKGMFNYCLNRHYPLPLQQVHDEKLERTRMLPFSEAEMQVITGICEGLSLDEIATMVFMSRSGVIRVRQRIMKKMGVKKSGGIVVYATMNNLI